jgi:hypothetical protein
MTWSNHALSIRRLGKLIVVWLIILASCASYGVFVLGGYEGGDFDLEGELPEILYYGGIGFSIATCLVVGFYVIRRVRAKSLTKGFGILFVLFSSAVSIVVPPIAMVGSGLFHGESGMMIYFQIINTVCLGTLAFVAFGLCILCIRKH